jgi:transcriptional regulator with XRE-family HTH domain
MAVSRGVADVPPEQEDLSTLDSLGRALAEARLNKNLSKSAAAKELGVSRQTYILWERGAQNPGVEQTDRLARFLEEDKEKVLNLLLRVNGFIDEDAYYELRKGSSRTFGPDG